MLLHRSKPARRGGGDVGDATTGAGGLSTRFCGAATRPLAPQHPARYRPAVAAPIVIKKYGNRRLYDTDESKYVTLDELAAKIRGGADLRVVDAQSGDDLTQATLTQIVLETGHAAKFLPVQLLTQMIRLSDDSLAEFFSRHVTGALDVYLQAKRGMQSMAAYNPLAQLPAAASDAIARMWMTGPFGYGGAGPSPYGQPQPQPQPYAPPQAQPYAGPQPYAPPQAQPYAGYPGPPYGSPPPEPDMEPAPSNGDRGDRGDRADRADSDVAAMRRELDELKQMIRDGARSAPAPGRSPRKKRKP